MKNAEITFKDLTTSQLNALKELFIESRVDSMTEESLRAFVKEVLELQVTGTVGNEEEKEVWKEMRDHFKNDFEHKR